MARLRTIQPSMQAMGFGIAGMVLATSVLEAAIRRGDITAEDSRAVIGRARQFLEKTVGKSSSEEKPVYQIAAESLRLAEEFLAMAAVECQIGATGIDEHNCHSP